MLVGQLLTGGIAMKQIETALTPILNLPRLTGGIAMKQIETVNPFDTPNCHSVLTGGIAMKQIETRFYPIIHLEFVDRWYCNEAN